jgi:hypothetical protein
MMPSDILKKIVVCPGTYPGAVTIDGINNLLVQGKKGARLIPGSTPFIDLIGVTNGANVTIKGLTLDGEMSLPFTGTTIAIRFSNASGAISGNTIINWHTDSYGTNLAIVGIQIVQSTPLVVKIDRNKIINYQNVAVQIYGAALVDITGNTITGVWQQYGILAQATGFGVPSGKIWSNKITGNGTPSGSTGIYILEGSSFIITKNTVTLWGIGIWIDTFCNSASNASFNQVLNNKVNETFMGIRITSVSSGSCDARADNNLVKGNKVMNSPAFLGGFGIIVSSNDPAPGAPISTAQNNLVTRNTIKHFSNPEMLIAISGGDVTGSSFTANRILP